MIYNPDYLRAVCYFIARNTTPEYTGALAGPNGAIIGSFQVYKPQFSFIEKGLVSVGYLAYRGKTKGRTIKAWIGPAITRQEDFTDEMLRRIDEAADLARKETHRRAEIGKLRYLTKNERDEKAQRIIEQINARIATLKELGYQVAFDCFKM